MKPRILIDASSVTPVVDGLSTYIVNIVKFLPAHAFDAFDFRLLTLPDVERPDLEDALAGKPIARIEFPVAPIGPRRDWTIRKFLRAHGGDFDLFHNTSNTYPLTLRGGICTIHDLTFRQWLDNPRGIPGARHIAAAYLSANIRHCLKHAERIIAVSQSTSDEIARQFRPTPEQMAKIHVVHEGWEHLQRPRPAQPLPPPSHGSGYVFFLGQHRRHKNVEGLLAAWELALPHLPAGKMLVISGGSERMSDAARKQIERLNAGEERVIFTGYLSNEDVIRHYEGADAFIFPSFSEGFGIPVLEAFRTGVPLLSSTATSLPEVAGDAALLFDPHDPQDMANAILRFYREPALASRLVARGRERLNIFSWAKAAEGTVAVYREALEQRA